MNEREFSPSAYKILLHGFPRARGEILQGGAQQLRPALADSQLVTLWGAAPRELG